MSHHEPEQFDLFPEDSPFADPDITPMPQPSLEEIEEELSGSICFDDDYDY